MNSIGGEIMRKIFIVVLACCAMFLTSCGKNETAKKPVNEPKVAVKSTSDAGNSSSGKKNSTSQTSKNDSVDKATTQAFWTPEKDKQLQNFMAAWGKVMGQSYQRNDEAHNTSYAGLAFPADFKSRTLAVDGQAVSVEWSPNGTGSSQYNVVAVFSAGEKSFGGHIYLFSIHNQQPVVLHTSQNQGMDDNMIHFNVTDNQDLKNGFTQIVSSGTAPEINQNPNVLEGYSAEQVLAAKVWLTKFGGVDPSVSSLAISHSPAGTDVGPVSGSVTFPRPTIGVGAIPVASGGLTYADNSDGTVTIYEVPSHFQDPRLLEDAEYGRQFTQNILDTAYTLQLKEFSNEQLRTFLTKLE